MIAPVGCLAAGLGLLFGYCHGTAGLNAAYPFDGASFHLVLVTTGLPAMFGFALTAIGLLLLLCALVYAILREAEMHQSSAPRQNRVAG